MALLRQISGSLLDPLLSMTDLTTPSAMLDGWTDSGEYINSSITWSDNMTMTPNSPPTSSSGPSMLDRFICEVCIVGPLALFGVVGNILAIIVLYRQKQQQGTVLFLQALALIDTSVLVTFLTLRSMFSLYHYTKTPVLKPYIDIYPYIFRWVYPFVYFFRLVDTWLVVLLTVDRYIAVRHPLHAQRLCTYPRAVRNLILMFLISFLFSIPRFFEYRVDLNTPFGFNQTDLIKDSTYTIGYRIVTFFIYQYLVPIVLLISLNAVLLQTLRSAETYRAKIAEGHTSRSRSITATVVAVVLVAILCNISALLAQLLWSLHIGFKEQFGYLEVPRRYLSLVSNIFVVLNSAVNFVIYCLCSRNFRTVLCRICRCRGKRVRFGRRQSSLRTTGTYISLAHSSTIRKKSNSTNLNNAYLPNKLYG